MAFKDKEEFFKLVRMLVGKIKDDKKLYDKLASSNISCGIKLTNIDSAFITVTGKNAQLDFEYGEPRAKSVTLVSGSDEIFNKFWQGKVNLIVAIATRQLKVGGAVASTTKLLNQLSGCYPKWVEVLKEAGRSDLIAK